MVCEAGRAAASPDGGGRSHSRWGALALVAAVSALVSLCVHGGGFVKSAKKDADFIDVEALERLSESQPDHEAVSYGSHPSQVLNFWAAKGEGPRPLIIEIHGGGWIQQDYRQVLPGSFPNEGISYAAIEYRRLCDPKVQKNDDRARDCQSTATGPIYDAARALQFLRHKAKKWNIDPEKIILKGGSAGGCTALWLTYHPDLADPASSDPIKRESTRVLATVANAAQSTIDPDMIKSWGMGDNVLEHFMMRDAAGPVSESGPTEEQTALYREMSPINWVGHKEHPPPVYMKYSQSDELPCTKNCIHSSWFGIKLWEKANTVGAETYLELEDKPKNSKLIWNGHSYENEGTFILDKLGMLGGI